MLPLNCIFSVYPLSSFCVSWVLNMLSSQLLYVFLTKNNLFKIWATEDLGLYKVTVVFDVVAFINVVASEMIGNW